MTRTKEILEDLRNSVVVTHQAGKGHKTISKEFGLHKSTVRHIVYKWRKFKTTVTLPKNGSPTKITPKARRLIVCQVAKEPRVTSKQLKAFLTVANVNVYEFIFRRTTKVCMTEFQEESHCSRKIIIARLQFAKDRVDKCCGPTHPGIRTAVSGVGGGHFNKGFKAMASSVSH